MADSELDIQQLLEAMVSLSASDLHMTVGSPPMYRINGDLRPVNMAPLSPKQTETVMLAMIPPAKRQQFDEIGTADFSFAVNGVGRYRVNVYHQRGSTALAIRLVSNHVPSIADLRLPPEIEAIAENHRGLILVTGVTGSGKSSTLAAIIRHINDTRRAHIITIEDPIEFLHSHNKSVVNQIELGVDTADLDTALKHVLRQDPDVILFGELRDRKSVKTALSATETGHLVFATLHTSDSLRTISRILNLFDAADENLILQELSMHLKAIISQRLVRTADGKHRIPACEILINNSTAAKLISEGRIHDLAQLVQNGEDGMMSFHHSLVEFVRAKKVTLEEGLKYVDDAAAFRRNVKGQYSGGDGRALVG